MARGGEGWRGVRRAGWRGVGGRGCVRAAVPWSGRGACTNRRGSTGEAVWAWARQTVPGTHPECRVGYPTLASGYLWLTRPHTGSIALAVSIPWLARARKLASARHLARRILSVRTEPRHPRHAVAVPAPCAAATTRWSVHASFYPQWNQFPQTESSPLRSILGGAEDCRADADNESLLGHLVAELRRLLACASGEGDDHTAELKGEDRETKKGMHA